MSLNSATFAELLAATRHSAVHLEMRDVYGIGDEAEDFEAFLRTGTANTDPSRSFWPQWVPLVTDAVARDVVMRRARIVSEPVTDYIRYEHAITPVNLQAGEDVRWLPRRHASDIPLPGNDIWLLDGRIVQFHHARLPLLQRPSSPERARRPAAALAPGRRSHREGTLRPVRLAPRENHPHPKGRGTTLRRGHPQLVRRLWRR